MTVLRLELPIPLIDRFDTVKDLAVNGGTQQLQVFSMCPDQRAGGAGWAADLQMILGAVGGIPDLFGEHVSRCRVALVSLDEVADVVPGRQFVVSAFTRKQRPDAALPKGAERAAVGALSVAVPVITKP